jgi:serine/threonine-protein kinase
MPHSPPASSPVHPSDLADGNNAVPQGGLGPRFTVLSQYAQGGRGRVFLARDEQLGRTVALKDVRPEVANQVGVRERFLAEAEITGQLEHPGTVPVYALERDAAGGPIYAMRFVEGRTLADAIDAAHSGNDAPRLRELLGRFVAVCRTVAYAHARGVIHRDLKPANIMLGDFGETLVVDWGLAKRVGSQLTKEGNASDPTDVAPDVDSGETTDFFGSSAGDTDQLTNDGQVVGTPAYMAPEQARGERDAVGPGADVYALGAVMYHLITNQRPYRGPTAIDVVRQVIAGPPPAPREVAGLVHPALNAICLKAMARLSADRYTSALALADDVERYLADEPTSAWREPWTVRGRRWVSRHRTLVTTMIAVALVTSACLVIATVLLTAANKREREAKEETAQQRDESARHYRMARRAVDRYHTEVSEDLLLYEPGMEQLRRRLLAAAREFYAEFAVQRVDDPEAKAELGRALNGINLSHNSRRQIDLRKAVAPRQNGRD